MVVRIQKYRKLRYFAGIKLDPKQKYAFFFLAADYGNLGDVAITFAQKKFIQENSVFRVIEIPISKSPEGLWFVSRSIKTDDIVTTVGGGNMGDLYDQIEYIRQLVVKFFPDNRIISFPQTFHFSETSQGQKALGKACKVYNSHKDIHIFARENVSYQLMKKYFKKVNIYLTPDIVFSLGKESSQKERSGAVFCLRNDKEKHLTEEQLNLLKMGVIKHFDIVSFYDTHINKKKMGVEEKERELQKLLDVFRSAELVITDRLHGMIFCYITNTPCLVIQNNNHKILGSYQWIKEDSRMMMVSEFVELRVAELFERIENKVVRYSDKFNEKYKLLKNLLS